METQSISLSHDQEKLISDLKNSLKFKLFLISKLPMAFLAGLKVQQLDANSCQTSTPYKYLNKNPFKSTYFAVLSMAAELSTGAFALMAVHKIKPSVAVIIVNVEAEFTKKASGRAYFTCKESYKAFDAVERCIASGEAETAKMKTEGYLKDGTHVATFYFTWSFKKRSR